MTAQPKVRFSAIRLNHPHVYSLTDSLLEAGAELVSYYAPEPELCAQYSERYPQAAQARGEDEILEDESIHLIVSTGVHDYHAPLGVRVMQHGKDYISDKPGFTTLEQLAAVRRVQAETGRFYSIFFGERLAHRATIKAYELVQAGAIGQVVQTVGLGPHLANLGKRPDWFFVPEHYGGTLNDLACHQIDQFLLFTGSTQAEVVASQVGNFNHPAYPLFEDFADVMLRGNGGTGYARVDWFTPDGLGTWGDGRLIVMGTDGFIEVRKNCDLAGREGDNHLFLVDHKATTYIDCADVVPPYGRQIVADVINRTETAMPQAHAFLASELTLRAQIHAARLGYLA